MFEAVILVCALEGTPCREALLPGFEAESAEACDAALRRGGAPPGARCRGAGEALAMDEVAPGVFVHRGLVEEPDASNRGDVANLGFVVGERSVAVIDTGSAAWIGEVLWRAIRQRSELPVSHVVLTHVHPDHVFGAGVFAGAEVVGHDGLGRALAERQENYLESFSRLLGDAFLGTTAPVVDREIAEGGEIDLGGRVLELRAWPTSHTSTDLTVLDRATGTLFAGDLVFDEHIPALDGSLRGWQAVLADLQGIEAARLIPGHGGPVLDWPEGGEPMARYLDLLASDTRAAIDAGERLAEAVQHIAQAEAGAWQLFEAFNARNATVAFTELEWE
ncbi:MAG: quinoprotein relay system zinc metallohydrolase 2 [Salipiger thiooxidans]|uniref:quinoprotein relay system zinc metallohydrolase 2 n=1 Tax=Salipiger thiooxidans TaxID=282683 RepID=UPI001CFC0E15|nr:quinoprotein relay system zinc metallohydrolase 2 [Salipiger thiooxidans]